MLAQTNSRWGRVDSEWLSVTFYKAKNRYVKIIGLELNKQELNYYEKDRYR